MPTPPMRHARRSDWMAANGSRAAPENVWVNVRPYVCVYVCRYVLQLDSAGLGFPKKHGQKPVNWNWNWTGCTRRSISWWPIQTWYLPRNDWPLPAFPPLVFPSSLSGFLAFHLLGPVGFLRGGFLLHRKIADPLHRQSGGADVRGSAQPGSTWLYSRDACFEVLSTRKTGCNSLWMDYCRC